MHCGPGIERLTSTTAIGQAAKLAVDRCLLKLVCCRDRFRFADPCSELQIGPLLFLRVCGAVHRCTSEM